MNYFDLSRAYQMSILFFFFVALMLFVLNTIISLRLKVRIYFTIFVMLMAISSFSFMMVIMWKVEYLNYIFLVVMVILSILLALSYLASLILYQKHHLTAQSFQEALDKISTGICFYDEKGNTRLVNKEMYVLASLSNKQSTLDGKEFIKEIQKENISSNRKDNVPVIVKYEDRVILYQNNPHTLNNHLYYEISANDISENYHLKNSLEEKNKELVKLNQRLVEYGEKINETIHDEEVLQAKIKIHDQMGKLLLLTKRRISTKMKQEEQDELNSIWKKEINAFSYIKEEPKKTDLEILQSACKLVDVTLHYNGTILNKSSKCEKLLIQAMHECLTNLVKHANGKNMYVKEEDIGNSYHIEITNDGKKPEREIKEIGGLSSLRQTIEKEGGRMIVLSQPKFKLELWLKKGEE